MPVTDEVCVLRLQQAIKMPTISALQSPLSIVSGKGMEDTDTVEHDIMLRYIHACSHVQSRAAVHQSRATEHGISHCHLVAPKVSKRSRSRRESCVVATGSAVRKDVLVTSLAAVANPGYDIIDSQR